MPRSGLDWLDSLTYVFGLTLPTNCMWFMISGYPVAPLEDIGYNILGDIFGYLHDQTIRRSGGRPLQKAVYTSLVKCIIPSLTQHL